MSKKTVLLNSLFFLALGLSMLFIKKFLDSSTKKPQKNNEHSIDAYMLNASYLRTNENGQRDIEMFSPVVTHIKYQDTSFLKEPKVFIYKNGDKWRVTSKRAKGVNGTNVFYLNDDVRVVQMPTQKKVETTLSTRSLTIYPKKDLVTTKEYVTIEQPGLTIKSLGLIGNLATGKIELLSNTRGQYDPKQSI